MADESRSFVIRDPKILDNGLIVPQEIPSGRAKRVVDALVPKDPDKPIVVETRAPEGLGIPRATGARAFIRSMETSFDTYDVTSIGSSRTEYLQGPMRVRAEVEFLVDPLNMQEILALQRSAGVTVYIAPDVPFKAPRVPDYGGTVFYMPTMGTAIWGR